MFWLPLAMAAASMAKTQFVDKPAQENANKSMGAAAAAQTQFSPWTGGGPGKLDVKPIDSTLGSGMQGGMAGLSMSQQFDQAAQQKNLANAQTDYYKSKANPWTGVSSQYKNPNMQSSNMYA